MLPPPLLTKAGQPSLMIAWLGQRNLLLANLIALALFPLVMNIAALLMHHGDLLLQIHATVRSIQTIVLHALL
jgi:hypothetical protein